MTGAGAPRGALLLLGLAACAAAGAAACRKDTTLGPPDSFLVYAPVEGAAGAAAGKSAAGLPVVEPMALDDARVTALHRQLVAGFPSEMLRTDYLAKQYVRDAAPGGHRYDEQARAAAGEPTVFLVGQAGEPVSRGLAVKGFWGTPVDHPGVSWLALPRELERDTALPQTLGGLLARQVALRIAGAGAPPVLVDGYARAMEVIAREWRLGEGPAGAVQPDAGTAAQRALFAGVRENEFTVGADGALRPPAEMLADANVAATVLYQLAQSKFVGRRVAPPEVYKPFVTDRIPPGISPALVLGPFRNFQAKLAAAWGGAVLAGHPPRDIAELVEAYARAMPAERAEAMRIFVVTTYGATVKPGGVRAANSDASAELTALAAEVAAGRRSSRAALSH